MPRNNGGVWSEAREGRVGAQAVGLISRDSGGFDLVMARWHQRRQREVEPASEMSLLEFFPVPAGEKNVFVVPFARRPLPLSLPVLSILILRSQ